MAWYDEINWGQVAGAAAGVAGAVYASKSQERQQRLALAQEQQLFNSLYGSNPGGNPGAARLDDGSISTGCAFCDTVRRNPLIAFAIGGVLLLVLLLAGSAK